MDYFHYRDQTLFAEECSLLAIAEHYGTPCYVYSHATLERHWHAFNDALGEMPHLICYSVKANSNLSVLNVFAKMGSGFDVVSIGELERVLAAKGDPTKVVFSGVGKLKQEIQRALEVGILCFNVESIPELERIQEIAKSLGKKAPVALRINPDVDAKTHPYISTGLKENKFGIAYAEAREIYLQAPKYPNLEFIGLDCHIGSQITELSPFLDALQKILVLLEELNHAGMKLKYLDLGGGLGVKYHHENPPHPRDLSAAIATLLQGHDVTIILEPGRAIVANAGILLTTVEYLKPQAHKNFAIVDAGMNDLMRPALYQAWQEIIPVQMNSESETKTYDIVGPVCETADFLGRERQLNLQPGDRLAIRGAGAYGFSMSSNYNTRPRPAEVMVEGDRHRLIRPRETITDLLQLEQRVSLLAK